VSTVYWNPLAHSHFVAQKLFKILSCPIWLCITSLSSYNTKPKQTKYADIPLPLPTWRCGPIWTMACAVLKFLDPAQWRTTFGRTPLDEWSACRRGLYLATHNIYNR